MNPISYDNVDECGFALHNAIAANPTIITGWKQNLKQKTNFRRLSSFSISFPINCFCAFLFSLKQLFIAGVFLNQAIELISVYTLVVTIIRCHLDIISHNQHIRGDLLLGEWTATFEINCISSVSRSGVAAKWPTITSHLFPFEIFFFYSIHLGSVHQTYHPFFGIMAKREVGGAATGQIESVAVICTW